DALVPPRRHAGGPQHLRLVALAEDAEAAVGDGERGVELLVEDECGAGRFIAEGLEERVGPGVGGEEAGAVWAAVDAEAEGAIRPAWSGPQDGRTAGGEVFFGLADQVAADSPVAGRRADRQRADHAIGRVEGGEVGVWSEAGEDVAEYLV